MKSREILVFLMVAISVLALATSVIAADELNITVNEVYFDGIQIAGSDGVAIDNTVGVVAGETVPIRIYFEVGNFEEDFDGEELTDAGDVTISARIQRDSRNSVEIDFPDLIEGSEHNARLSLRLPSDLDETEEELTLYVRIESDEGNWEEAYTVLVQRESYKANVLFVEVDSNLRAGSTVPVDIVISNLGRHELEDVIVSVRIPGLGIERRSYFGDMTPTDDEDEYGDDAEDAVERRMFLSIPSNALPGIYTLEVEAYNDDTSSSVVKNIAIGTQEVDSKILTAVTSKEVAKGGSVTYELILVNSGNNIGIYEIIPEASTNLVVTVDQPLLTVPAGSSKVVRVNVQAGDSIGTYAFAVNVNSNGQLVERVDLSANVLSRTASVGGTSNVVILTVVLAIVFLVLLVVLIVLLSRKPEKSEEFGESYY